MLERFKMSWRFLSLLLIFFWILLSSFFSGWMFLSSFWSTVLIWVPVSFLSLLIPCTFSFVALSIAFICSSNLWPNSTNSVSFLIISVLNCASDRLAISSSLSYIFLELWSDLSFGPFFLCWHACYVKGRSLRCSPGQGNTGRCAVMLYVGEGSDREQWQLPCSLPVFSHSLRYPQSNWAPQVLLPEWVGLCMF